jgi:hypothetical protein
MTTPDGDRPIFSTWQWLTLFATLLVFACGHAVWMATIKAEVSAMRETADRLGVMVERLSQGQLDHEKRIILLESEQRN